MQSTQPIKLLHDFLLVLSLFASLALILSVFQPAFAMMNDELIEEPSLQTPKFHPDPEDERPLADQMLGRPYSKDEIELQKKIAIYRAMRPRLRLKFAQMPRKLLEKMESHFVDSKRTLPPELIEMVNEAIFYLTWKREDFSDHLKNDRQELAFFESLLNQSALELIDEILENMDALREKNENLLLGEKGEEASNTWSNSYEPSFI